MVQSPWEIARRLLKDLADELAASESEGTLPQTLSLDHVWIDDQGRVRLVDAPPVRAASPFGRSHVQQARVAGGTLAVPLAGSGRAARLLLLTGYRLLSGTTIPVHAQTFLQELSARLDAPDAMTWACERLRALVEAPGELRWDERLGMLCVSAGIELTLYGGMIAGTASLLKGRLGDWRVLSAWLVAALLLPAIVAWFSRGGPLFRLMGLEVRRANGRPAGRLRCAWRGLIAWLPFALLYAQSAVAATSGGNEVILGEVLLSCSAFLVAVFIPIGIAWSLLRPAAGLQDLLAGTRLARR